MFLPPPLNAAAGRAGSTAGPRQLHWAGHSYSNAQDAVAAADRSRTHQANRSLLHAWEWAASQITGWVNSASSASRTSHFNSDITTKHDGHSHIISDLRKRTTSQDLDVTIGIVVGVLLGIFLLGTLAFCYVYRNSIRFKRKRKFQRQQRRHKSGGSRGSKNSKSSRSSDSSAGGDGGGGGGGDAEAAPAPPAEGG
ncbi:7 transmembrane receptor (rhodopsin family) domain-containing protein [Apiospora phragmitis]|uniref:7 transmembrane receptor (Rhodopsin family) domain-containing protein n=1 Tax=Apiospora phragmitis TaxID=2905665 RepID=A0ABR1W242_9PEZI